MALITSFMAGKSGRMKMDICSCDTCGVNYEQRSCVTVYRRSAKLAQGKDYCLVCIKKIIRDNIAAVGTLALSKLSKQERIKNAAIGGKAANAKYDPLTNKTRFSKEFWEGKTQEEKYKYAKRASDGLQEKLKDPIYAAQHFAKVLSQKQLGFQSKAHIHLHSLIEKYGFKSHVRIGSMEVDECHEELKIVVEYNGDFWHCNPREWKAEQYNKGIKMTAGEKWQKDIARKKMLKKYGYHVIVIWEKAWIKSIPECLAKIENLIQKVKSERENNEAC